MFPLYRNTRTHTHTHSLAFSLHGSPHIRILTLRLLPPACRGFLPFPKISTWSDQISVMQQVQYQGGLHNKVLTFILLVFSICRCTPIIWVASINNSFLFCFLNIFVFCSKRDLRQRGPLHIETTAPQKFGWFFFRIFSLIVLCPLSMVPS